MTLPDGARAWRGARACPGAWRRAASKGRRRRRQAQAGPAPQRALAGRRPRRGQRWGRSGRAAGAGLARPAAPALGRRRGRRLRGCLIGRERDLAGAAALAARQRSGGGRISRPRRRLTLRLRDSRCGKDVNGRRSARTLRRSLARWHCRRAAPCRSVAGDDTSGGRGLKRASMTYMQPHLHANNSIAPSHRYVHVKPQVRDAHTVRAARHTAPHAVRSA